MRYKLNLINFKLFRECYFSVTHWRKVGVGLEWDFYLQWSFLLNVIHSFGITLNIVCVCTLNNFKSEVHLFLFWNLIFQLCNIQWQFHVLVQAGLTNLETLNLDSCAIGDEGLVHLAGNLAPVIVIRTSLPHFNNEMYFILLIEKSQFIQFTILFSFFKFHFFV